MSPCMHGCGRPAAPRTGSRGPAPRSCSECRTARRLETSRQRLARDRAADPEGIRLERRVRRQVWRERLRAEAVA